MTAAQRRWSTHLRTGAVCAAALLIATTALSGCVSTPRPRPSATALPEGISASLEPSAVPGHALVVFDNEGVEKFLVRSMRIEDPRFQWAAWPTSLRDRTVGGGTVSLVPVALPSVRCDAAVGEGPRLTVQYSLGASMATASAAIADPSGVVTSFRTAACGS